MSTTSTPSNTYLTEALADDESVIRYLISEALDAAEDSPEAEAEVMVEALAFAAGDVIRNGGSMLEFVSYAIDAYRAMDGLFVTADEYEAEVAQAA